MTYEEISVLCLEKIIDEGIGRNCKYILKFHSSFFHFPELKNILVEFMISDHYEEIRVSRLDICLDIDKGVDEFLDLGYKTQFLVKEERKRSDKLQTLYLGTRNATNKKHFIRIYNKLLDTQRKAKFGLYQEYFAYEKVTRIEVQINSQSCLAFGISLSNIGQAEFLKTVYKSCCVNQQGTYFNVLDVPDFHNLNIIKRKAPPKSEILEKLPYAKIMLGYAKNLLKAGFDPIRFLQKHLQQ